MTDQNAPDVDTEPLQRAENSIEDAKNAAKGALDPKTEGEKISTPGAGDERDLGMESAPDDVSESESGSRREER